MIVEKVFATACLYCLICAMPVSGAGDGQSWMGMDTTRITTESIGFSNWSTSPHEPDTHIKRTLITLVPLKTDKLLEIQCVAAKIYISRKELLTAIERNLPECSPKRKEELGRITAILASDQDTVIFQTHRAHDGVYVKYKGEYVELEFYIADLLCKGRARVSIGEKGRLLRHIVLERYSQGGGLSGQGGRRFYPPDLSTWFFCTLDWVS